jgi:hypothetical protein
MALPPSNDFTELTSQALAEVNHLEKEIDGYLEALQLHLNRSGTAQITIPAKEFYHPDHPRSARVQDEVCIRYKNVGWRTAEFSQEGLILS